VLHAVVNARALHGDAAFVRAVELVQGIPLLPLVEVLVVYAPLVVHGGLGLWLTATRRSLGPAPYSRGVRVAMRVTGIVLAAFLAMHLPELRFYSPRVHLDGGELATRLDADLSTVTRGVPARGLAYLVGTASAAFHLAAGAWAAFASTAKARASVTRRRYAAWALVALGTAMWLTLANVVVFRATGAQLFGEPLEETPSTPCP
jgi:succinate dehydrogenase / fumarate reductase cytochrome b subunit